MFHNGITSIAQGGLNGNTGLTIQSGGLTVSGGVAVYGDAAMSGGTISVTSGSATAASTDVFSSSAAFDGNVILGKVAAGAYNSNLLVLLAGSSILYQVCSFVTGCGFWVHTLSSC